MTIINGTSTSDYYIMRMDYSLSHSATTTTCSITLQIYWKKHHSHNLSNERPVYVNGTGQGQVNFYPTGSYEKNAGGVVNLGTTTYSWNRGTSNEVKTISGYAKRSTGSTSSVSTTITVPARDSYVVSFNENKPSSATGTVQNVPGNQTKYYGYALTLSSAIPTLEYYVFSGWNTAADGSGTAYAAGGSLPANVNTATTLYAQWAKAYVAPIIEGITLDRVETSSGTTPYDEGNYLCVTLTNYTSGDVPADGNSRYKQTSVTLTITENGNTHTLSPLDSASFTGTGATKRIHYHVPTTGYSPSYPTSESYPITLTFTTADHGSLTYSAVLPTSIYPIEVAEDGTMIAFGVPARFKQELYLDVDPNAVAGTTDADLYAALDALGWWNDVNV